MDLLSGYRSSDDGGSSDRDDEDVREESSASPQPPQVWVEEKARAADWRYLNAAPRTSVLSARPAGTAAASGAGGSTALALRNPPSSGLSSAAIVQPRGQKLLMNNPLKSQLLAPVAGPALDDPSGPKP